MSTLEALIALIREFAQNFVPCTVPLRESRERKETNKCSTKGGLHRTPYKPVSLVPAACMPQAHCSNRLHGCHSVGSACILHNSTGNL